MALAQGYFRTPPVIKNLLIINIIIFMAEIFLPANISNAILENGALTFWKGGGFKAYQLVTYMFLHGGFGHVFWNMFALWMFGRILEHEMGSKRFLVYYFACGVGAGLVQLGVNWIEFSAAMNAGNLVMAERLAHASTIGASGAVFGILLAFGMTRPNDIIMLLFPPIPLKAKWFVIIYGLIELYMGISGSGGSIAHFAHLGGMLFGFFLLRYWKKKGELHY